MRSRRRCENGGKRIRQPVQIQALLTQGLAVIGDIKQHAIDAVRCATQRFNRAAEYVIGVRNRIVVRVDYFVRSARRF